MLIRSMDCRGHTLALTYNDMSPNENHHASSGFALLRRSENNFLRRMSKKNMVRTTAAMSPMQQIQHSWLLCDLQCMQPGNCSY